MVSIRLPDGTVISGTTEQVNALMNKLGLSKGIYYNSESHGPILISEMNTVHLKNSVLKLYAQWVNDLHYLNAEEVVERILEGNTDETFVAMLRQLGTRTDA